MAKRFVWVLVGRTGAEVFTNRAAAYTQQEMRKQVGEWPIVYEAPLHDEAHEVPDNEGEAV